ncbi:GSCOCG00012267001-RA-CDS [Cotesia congregata]|nr:GSCOCG00012267001-RA-CDS [Cotesia congregata]
MKKVFPNDELVKLVSEGTNVEDFAEQLRKQSKKAIQPYLITHLGQSVDKTFIQGDEWFIGVHPASKTITSFDLLYKTYYVLNVEYPEKLKNFYNFIDYYIFQMKINPKSMVSSLHTNIVNFKIDTNDKSYKSNKNNNSQDLSEDDVSD